MSLPTEGPVARGLEVMLFATTDRHPRLTYVVTVHHGIPLTGSTLRQEHGAYLLFCGRIHPDKGVAEAIAVAQRAHMPLYIAGIIPDKGY